LYEDPRYLNLERENKKGKEIKNSFQVMDDGPYVVKGKLATSGREFVIKRPR